MVLWADTLPNGLTLQIHGSPVRMLKGDNFKPALPIDQARHEDSGPVELAFSWRDRLQQ